jgi:uncharacterized OB-fold protein
MSDQTSFTIEQFYRNVSQGKLLGAKCRKCGKIHLPPRPLCDNCLSKEFDWTDFPKKGMLLTYTVIHIAPAQFQDVAPYAMGIVEFGKDLKLPGMIHGAPLDKIKIGMELTIEFGTEAAIQSWPKWPRYYFKPL